FAERKRADGAIALVLFDMLHLDDRSIMREPWRDRRKRLEDLVDGQQLLRVGTVPVTEDPLDPCGFCGRGSPAHVGAHLVVEPPRGRPRSYWLLFSRRDRRRLEP